MSQTELTDDELRARVAECAGWEPSGLCRDITGRPFEEGPPEYPNDLNSCAEFEAGLSEEEQARYTAELYADFLNADYRESGIEEEFWHRAADLSDYIEQPAAVIFRVFVAAPPRSRCLAFLRVKGAA